MLKHNIIAIGGSSGSLVPLINFFDASVLNDAAYVILRHMPIDYQSKLSEILQLHTLLDVVQGMQDAPLESGKVYYAPPNYYLVIKNGYLNFVNRVYGQNHTVDIFMESLALHQNSAKSIAVILSGEGSDGVKGAAAIRNAGGLVLVQTPESCDYPTLPKAVIESGNANFVLLPQQMPMVIQEYVDQNGHKEKSLIYNNLRS